jgi:hypothetical protein
LTFAIAPSGRLLKVPAIGAASVLLIMVKTVPGGEGAAAEIVGQNPRAAAMGLQHKMYRFL